MFRAFVLLIVNYLTVFKPCFVDEELSAIFEMFSFNLFRPLPPNTFDRTGHYNPGNATHKQAIYAY